MSRVCDNCKAPLYWESVEDECAGGCGRIVCDECAELDAEGRTLDGPGSFTLTCYQCIEDEHRERIRATEEAKRGAA